MGNQVVAVIGHSDCSGLKEEVVREAIKNLIGEGYEIFLNGGMGQFDWMCARILFEWKGQYTQIRSYLVIPYLTFSVLEPRYFDEIIYPEGLEQYYFKPAILKRNQYLVEQADTALCYVNHDWGGAAKTYRLAMKKGLRIINLG